MSNLAYIEELYRLWKEDAVSVPESWDAYFRNAESTAAAAAPLPSSGSSAEAPMVYKQSRVDSLLWAYRDIGYIHAELNPLGGNHGPEHSYLGAHSMRRYEDLTLDAFGLGDADLETVFHAGRSMQLPQAPLRDIVAALRETYCRTIGAEFLHIQDKQIRRWLIYKMESTRNQPRLSKKQRRKILSDLLRTQALEQALHRYFTGQKRFSLAGSESVIPALHYLVNSAGRYNIEELAIGTTHRGRLSILNTILKMSPSEIFSRFEETHLPEQAGGTGDVKYHIGYDTVHRHKDGSTIRIRLPANASHVESIAPILEGMACGLRDEDGDKGRHRVLPVLLHGDAAFSGQGVVSETLNLSQLEGYRTGGTIHIIINNQIGFTTSARSARSSTFPTDAVKGLQVPVFHVNGDDPEALVHVMDLALQFRQEFARDFVVDVFCFRRHGHNEGDDPSFTHPYMYRLIKDRPSVVDLYGQRCVSEGVLSMEDQEAIVRKYDEGLRRAYDQKNRNATAPKVPSGQGKSWEGLRNDYSQAPVDTGVPVETLQRIFDRVTTVPDDFNIHPRLKRILERKGSDVRESGAVDWALAETLAFGSLLLEGTPVRLCGEDSVRGTFSQRHLAWWDVESATPRSYVPLNELSGDQAPLLAYDSPLSEFAALGFEYGYSLVRPRALVIWEAQFGDFVNGAQVVVDNYIASAEAKWGQHSGLVLLLPHGNEGQGPDHSSAHLERFLTLCAEENMEVCNPTTPAQYFHLLRRQVRRDFRKPLIVMAPKSLLRLAAAVSPLSALSQGNFQPVLDDPSPPEKPDRVVLCSGKLCYDLLDARGARADSSCAIVRLEQLHPFPADALRKCLARYGDGCAYIWAQEEPRNAGAWRYLREQETVTPGRADLQYVGRPASASSATGLHRRFEREQPEIVARALGGQHGT